VPNKNAQLTLLAVAVVAAVAAVVVVVEAVVVEVAWAHTWNRRYESLSCTENYIGACHLKSATRMMPSHLLGLDRWCMQSLLSSCWRQQHSSSHTFLAHMTSHTWRHICKSLCYKV
jgi:hypothetical protein